MLLQQPADDKQGAAADAALAACAALAHTAHATVVPPHATPVSVTSGACGTSGTSQEAPSVTPSDGMMLYVETLTGKRIVLQHLEASDTVASLKAKIQEQDGSPLDQQRLSNVLGN